MHTPPPTTRIDLNRIGPIDDIRVFSFDTRHTNLELGLFSLSLDTYNIYNHTYTAEIISKTSTWSEQLQVRKRYSKRFSKITWAFGRIFVNIS